jgi:hypothetical protein
MTLLRAIILAAIIALIWTWASYAGAPSGQLPRYPLSFPGTAVIT